MEQQCPELDTVDVDMYKEPHINEGAPMGSSLSITLQVEEGALRKSNRADRSHKRLAFGLPKILEPATSDPLHAHNIKF